MRHVEGAEPTEKIATHENLMLAVHVNGLGVGDLCRHQSPSVERAQGNGKISEGRFLSEKERDAINGNVMTADSDLFMLM